MNTIGFRVEPSAVTFVVYDTSTPAIVAVEQIKIPKALTVPEALKYVRVNVIDVLREFKIQKAGIRITESNAQNASAVRLQIEAIILEAFASSSLEEYVRGQISNLSSLLNIDRPDFKKFVDGEEDYTQVENWSTLSKIQREACFAAIGGANA